MDDVSYNLFPEIEPYHQDWYASENLHKVYFEVCGNPEGYPVLFLHGGPGSGCNPSQRRFFDPSYYRIILFDQRGCGRSLPLGETRENTTALLVQDIEGIRQQLGIDRWLIFGGSWGSTLGLCYALRHKAHISGMILRGIFLSRSAELEWFLGKVQQFHPEAWKKLTGHLPDMSRQNPLAYYASLVFGDDFVMAVEAAKHWNAFEASILSLRPVNNSKSNSVSDETHLARAKVQMHYILNQCYVDAFALLPMAHTLTDIPIRIIQGRYDMVCPPITAWELKNVLPHADYVVVEDAGHSAMEPGILSALVKATEDFKCVGRD